MTLGELVCAIMGCLDFELRLNSVLYIRRINSLAWITMTVNIWFQSISLEKISHIFCALGPCQRGFIADHDIPY